MRYTRCFNLAYCECADHKSFLQRNCLSVTDSAEDSQRVSGRTSSISQGMNLVIISRVLSTLAAISSLSPEKLLIPSSFGVSDPILLL